MCIKAIFFDMDGTLVYVPISSTQFPMNIYQELGLNFSLEQIAVARRKTEKWWNEKFSDYTLRTSEAFVESNYKLLAALGAKGDLQRLAEKVQSHWENFPEEADEKLYPEVESVLETLREEGITLAVLSDRLIDFSLKSLEKHGIRGYFQSVIGPRIAGAPKGKLSLEMWRYALRRAGARPNEVFHIDNDYETGIMGAREAGIRPILLDRKETYTSIIDCTTIHDLTENPRFSGVQVFQQVHERSAESLEMDFFVLITAIIGSGGLLLTPDSRLSLERNFDILLLPRSKACRRVALVRENA